jgi:hypothetical protein
MHIHIFSSTQPQKVALTTILPLHFKAKVQAGLHSLSLNFFLPKYLIQKLLQLTIPSRKNLLLP